MIGGDRTADRHRIFDAYVPRGVLAHLAAEPFRPVRTVSGTMAFADLSGFTALSERLARRGPEGAELLVETINACFASLLRVAYDNGGSLVKFGGDALLLFFEGDAHAARAGRAAVRMRERLRTVGRVEVAGVKGTLRMTVGLHSDAFHFALVGSSHLEHLVLGPGATGVVRAEAAACTGQIVVSGRTGALLPLGCLGPETGPHGAGARLLRRSPLDHDVAPDEPLSRPPDALVGRTLSTAVRAHVLGGSPQPEHRRASVAFLRFGGTDALVAAHGPDAAAAAVHNLVTTVQRAADDYEVCFLDSDIDADGGKLLLVAGAPRVVGDDEERMLLTLRQILDERERQGAALPIRIGVNRGPTFTGEIGPAYRRAYIVMGDTTNLAARVMSQAPPGSLYATAGILERSSTRFDTVALGPFAAKGKARPVQAWSVGPAIRPYVLTAAHDLAWPGAVRLPLMGREGEIDVLAKAVAELGRGRGTFVEIAGDAGIGKSRLLAEFRARAGSVVGLRAAGAAHTAALPYAIWQVILRQVLGVGWDTPDSQVWDLALRRCPEIDPELEAWAPLLADALGVAAEVTPQVAALAPEFRRARRHDTVVRFLAPALCRPTLLEVESAHLVDEASLALLLALIPLLASAPWLIVVTRRGGPSRSEVPAGPGAVRLELAPLSAADTRALAEAATDARPLVPHRLDAAVERSGGNPQFLLDLLAAAGAEAGELPDSAQAAAMAQIDALAPGDRALVRYAGVLGSGFGVAHLAAVLGRAETELAAAISTRLGAVFDLDGEDVAFRRAAVREAAYGSLPFRERRAVHAQAATALQAREDGGGVRADPAVLGRHFAKAGDHARALPLILRAADRATAYAAGADAAGLYRSALESARAIDPTLTQDQIGGLWESLGEAERLAGDPAAADRAYREARRLATDPVRVAELLYRQARLAHRLGHGRASVRWARAGLRALAGCAGERAAAWRACLLMAEAADRLQQGRLPEAIRLCRDALAEAERGAGPAADRATAHACYILDWALVDSGRSAEAVHSPRALEIYDRLGDLEDKANVVNNLGMFAYYEGRWDDAVRLYREAAALAERVGDVIGAAYGDLNVGEVLADQGHWVDAAALLHRCLRLWRAADDAGSCAFARMLLGRLAVREGRYGEGLDLLAGAVVEFRRLGLEYVAVAEAYQAEGAAQAGYGDRALGAVARLLPSAPDRLVPLLLRARAFASVSQGPDAVAAALDESLAAARREGSDYDTAAALDARVHLPGDRRADAAERDELFARLGVVRLPAPLF